MEISKKIDKVFRDSNLQVKEFVKKINITEQTFYNYTSGRSKPGWEFIRNIVTEFDVDAYWLLGVENKLVGGVRSAGEGRSAADCERELAHLRELLAEKERLIQVLLNK